MNDTVDSVVPVTISPARCGHHYSEDCHSCRSAWDWSNAEMQRLQDAERKHEAEVERLREALRKVQSEALHGEVAGLKDGAANWRSSLRLIGHVARLSLEATQ